MTAAKPHRLIASPVIRDGRHYHSSEGPMYSVSIDGEPLVASTRQPLLDGARALKAKGLSGPVELWDTERPFPRMRSIVEAAAGLTVQEGKRQSPKLAKWVPFEGLSHEAKDGLPGQGLPA